MAAPSITLQSRLLYLEDLSQSATLATTTDTVFGLGPVTVTPFVTAASDAAAAALGLNVGDIYIWTGGTPNRLRTRMV